VRLMGREMRYLICLCIFLKKCLTDEMPLKLILVCVSASLCRFVYIE
jgi:hypothetical protein